jgi:phage baseplate assembly protein W
MGLYTQQDIQITDAGDFLVDDTGDLALASIDQTTRQDVIFYLYTEYGDFTGQPDLGSRVVDFIGEPNTKTNAQLLRAEMIRALTTDGRFSSRDIGINMVPVGIDEVLSYITIQNSAMAALQTFIFDFNYISGIQIAN